MGWRGVEWDGVGCVAWRGVAWRGVAWRGVAWRGVAWRGVAWRGVAWRGVAWRGQNRTVFVLQSIKYIFAQLSTMCDVGTHYSGVQRTLILKSRVVLSYLQDNCCCSSTSAISCQTE